jgi:2-polyprenyl-3-methyl-5-hydroxy-6-metoxy-1,4-benzoquinol methylase
MLNDNHEPQDVRVPAWHCPEHGAKLAEDACELQCPWGHAYPIVRDIPRFHAETQYVEHFGKQWNTYVVTQLDSQTGIPISRDRLRRALGEVLWASLAGKTVLECGCGAGRFTEILLERGAIVVSVDLSSAVEANAGLFPVNRRHRVAQADICALPFAEQSFDIVLCLGVVQHTPKPEHTIDAIYRFVKPGGSLIIDHYARNWRRYTTTAPLVRQILKRVRPEKSIVITRALVDFFLPIHRRFIHHRVLNSALSRVSPIRCYYKKYPQLSEESQREFAFLDTHDSLTDWYKHLRTPREIRRTLERLGLANIECRRGGNGIEARGVRPNKVRSSKFSKGTTDRESA